LNLKYSNILGLSLLSFFIFEGLDAYSVNNIPIYWIGASLFIAIFSLLFAGGFRASVNKIIPIRNWTIYVIFVTLVQSLFNDLVLPKYASTTYFQYISLRLIKILLFLIILYTLNYLLSTYSFDIVLKYFLISSLIISLLSLISYFSYIFGYPDFPRTRSGSGGWTQPIAKACNILRNYGTFREPSFLAIWTVPFLPYFFYIGKKNKIWYFLALIPILSVVLSRSLTGFVALLVSSALVLVASFIIYRRIEINIALMMTIFIFVVFISNSLSYQFPPDQDLCESKDNNCVCEVEDRLDQLKSSQNISEATFGRFKELTSLGLDAFENTTFLIGFIQNNGFSIFGNGFGHSNIIYSYAADEASKTSVDEKIVYRNPGQVVSFNNLYANVLLSSGLLGLLWFLYIIINHLRKLIFTIKPLQSYILVSLISILFMYSYQAEELATHLAISLAFIINLSENE
tara:strand:- start:2355 stop:3728 length:1374 start_codon:yes stop_codon:yes gene_type:complete